MKVLKPGKILVDYGPVTMLIEASQKGEPATEAALSGAKIVSAAIEELTSCLAAAFREITGLPPELDQTYPEILRLMVTAVRAVGEPDLTPMAAVAGSFAELVKNAAVEAGADRVYVNNGGDIALYIGEEDHLFRVGILRDLNEGKITHLLHIRGADKIGGVATSGLGGRSLTKGVASAVTVLAADSPLADAAATAVANAVNCESKAVVRCLAEEIDDRTDIKGHTVTKSVGLLTDYEIETALTNGIEFSRRLIQDNVIKGAIIFVQGQMRSWPPHLAAPLNP